MGGGTISGVKRLLVALLLAVVGVGCGNEAITEEEFGQWTIWCSHQDFCRGLDQDQKAQLSVLGCHDLSEMKALFTESRVSVSRKIDLYLMASVRYICPENLEEATELSDWLHDR